MFRRVISPCVIVRQQHVLQQCCMTWQPPGSDRLRRSASSAAKNVRPRMLPRAYRGTVKASLLHQRRSLRTSSKASRPIEPHRLWHRQTSATGESSGPPRRNVRAASTSRVIAAVVGVAIFSSLVAYRVTIASSFEAKNSDPNSPADPANASEGVTLPALQSIMVAPIPPGRPGNLTAEQEVKLREFWVALLHIFDIHPEQGSADAASTRASILTGQNDSAHEAPRTDAVAPAAEKEKKKKKHLGLFGKSRKDRDNASSAASETTAPATTATTGAAATSTSATTAASGAGGGGSDHDDKYGERSQFRRALASLQPAELRAAFWGMVKHDNPDALLLRFLRARKWDVDKALVMLVSTVHWRAYEMHVDDDVIRLGEPGAIEAAHNTSSSTAEKRKDAEDFLKAVRVGKSYLHGMDRDGRPMCWVHARLHRSGEQTEQSIERYTVYVIETARYLLTETVDTAAVLFDLTDFSMANMDYAPVKFIIKCFEANYPESLGVIIVHKAPWIFQGIWAIIRGWLDPVVAGKVHFTKTVEDLEAFIPKSRILKELGGDEDWSYKFVEPRDGENSRMTDGASRQRLQAERDELVQQYEQATLTWLGPQTAAAATATTSDRAASVDGARAAEEGVAQERGKLAAALRANYWRLDPYVRARTIYDRIGVIRENGSIAFYPDNPLLSSSSEAQPAAQ